MSLETILRMQKIGEMSKTFTQELINLKALIDNDILTEDTDHISQLIALYNIVFNNFQQKQEIKKIDEYLNNVGHYLRANCNHDFVTDEFDINDHVLVITYCQICKSRK